MKIAAINGSPRKKWNTDNMLNAFIDGVKQAEIETEIIRVDLYNYTYSGCRECFLCKLKDDRLFGKCNLKDEITPVLNQLEGIDGIVFATPVFYDDISGQMKTFLERFLFPKDSWSNPREMLFDKHIFSTMLYTMNNTEKRAKERGYFTYFSKTERYLNLIFQEIPDHAYAFNTYGLNDYDKYKADKWNVDEKKQIHEDVFPKELDVAKKLGIQMVGKIKEYQTKNKTTNPSL